MDSARTPVPSDIANPAGARLSSGMLAVYNHDETYGRICTVRTLSYSTAGLIVAIVAMEIRIKGITPASLGPSALSISTDADQDHGWSHLVEALSVAWARIPIGAARHHVMFWWW